MSSLLTKPLVQHHLSRVSPIELRDFPLPRIRTPKGITSTVVIALSGHQSVGISHANVILRKSDNISMQGVYKYVLKRWNTDGVIYYLVL